MGEGNGEKKELPKRKDIRLKNYDYSSPGAYFVTICKENRKNYFLNESIDPQKFNWCSVGANCVRPQNLLLMVVISADEYGRPQVAPTAERMVKQFKGAATKKIGASIWQKSYIEHVIRDKKDYETRSNYIFENPLRWYYDELYTEE